MNKITADKPIAPPGRLPEDGWEYVEIKEREPAYEEAMASIDNKKYAIHVEAEALMAVRNLKYKAETGGPLYDEE